MHRVLDWLSGRPYLLLTLTMLMWGGNAVAGRLAVGEVSPMALTGLRWVMPVAVLGVALRYQLLTHRQALLERWPLILLMYARPHGVQRPVLPRGPPHDGGQPHHPTRVDAGFRAGRSTLVLRHAHPRLANHGDDRDPARRSPRRDAG